MNEDFEQKIAAIRARRTHEAYCYVCHRSHATPNDPNPTAHPGLSATLASPLPGRSVWIGGHWGLYGVALPNRQNGQDDFVYMNLIRVKVLLPGLMPQDEWIRRDQVWLTPMKGEES